MMESKWGKKKRPLSKIESVAIVNNIISKKFPGGKKISATARSSVINSPRIPNKKKLQKSMHI